MSNLRWGQKFCFYKIQLLIVKFLQIRLAEHAWLFILSVFTNIPKNIEVLHSHFQLSNGYVIVALNCFKFYLTKLKKVKDCYKGPPGKARQCGYKCGSPQCAKASIIYTTYNLKQNITERAKINNCQAYIVGSQHIFVDSIKISTQM